MILRTDRAHRQNGDGTVDDVYSWGYVLEAEDEGDDEVELAEKVYNLFCAHPESEMGRAYVAACERGRGPLAPVDVNGVHWVCSSDCHSH